MTDDIIEVLILSGGRGTRLQSIIKDVPKPMAQISGRPFLEWLIRNLTRQGFNNICFLTGYMAPVIKEYFGEKSKEARFRYSHEESPLGTGGAIKRAIESSEFKKFLVLNGDTYFNINFPSFLDRSIPHFRFSVALKRVKKNFRYGAISLDHRNFITQFVKNTKYDDQLGPSLINAGVYYLESDITKLIGNNFVSLEASVFPLLAKNCSIGGIEFSNEFIDIGIPEDYSKAQNLVNKWFFQSL